MEGNRGDRRWRDDYDDGGAADNGGDGDAGGGGGGDAGGGDGGAGESARQPAIFTCPSLRELGACTRRVGSQLQCSSQLQCTMCVRAFPCAWCCRLRWRAVDAWWPAC
jgi:hypothetical protein